jgi:hypothetical protein
MENEASFLNTEGSDVFPVITLYQPWATWIMREWKTIETRTHDRFACLKNRTVLIHAGQTTDGSDLTTKNKYLTKEQIMFNPDEVVNGVILGSARVYNVRWLWPTDSKYALIDCEHTKRFGLELDHIKKFDSPIPVKGEMGIWYYDLTNRMKIKKPSAAGVFKKDAHQTSLWNTH